MVYCTSYCLFYGGHRTLLQQYNQLFGGFPRTRAPIGQSDIIHAKQLIRKLQMNRISGQIMSGIIRHRARKSVSLSNQVVGQSERIPPHTLYNGYDQKNEPTKKLTLNLNLKDN